MSEQVVFHIVQVNAPKPLNEVKSNFQDILLMIHTNTSYRVFPGFANCWDPLYSSLRYAKGTKLSHNFDMRGKEYLNINRRFSVNHLNVI